MKSIKKFGKSRLELKEDDKNGSAVVTTLELRGKNSPASNEFLQSVNADLQQSIKNQAFKIQDQNKTIQNLGEEKGLLESQVWSFSGQLTNACHEVNALRANAEMFDERMQSLCLQIQTLERRTHEQTHELENRSNTIKILSSHNQKLQHGIAELENLVRAASEETGTDLQALFATSNNLKSVNETLVSKLKTEVDSRSTLEGRIIEMQNQINATSAANEEQIASLRVEKEVAKTTSDKSLEALRAEMAALEAVHNEQFADLQSENETLRTVIDEIQKEATTSGICQPQTLRGLLTLRLVERHWNETPDDETSRDAHQGQNWLPLDVNQNSLDRNCTPTEIQRLATSFPKSGKGNEFYQRLRLVVCSRCSKAKFSFRTDPHSHFNTVKWLNEYVGKTRYFSCCHEEICRDCFREHLLASLASKWWYKLGTNQWLPCPRDDCGSMLGIRCEADLETCLSQVCGIDAEQYVKRYVKALAFRSALEGLEDRPSHEALEKACKLHERLLQTDKMFSLFDARFDPGVVDETGCIPEFVAGTIFSCHMDNEESSVPLFLKFLRRRRTPKLCIVCSKNMFDIDYGDTETWKISCEGFEGSWMWNILVFPTTAIQQCDHDSEVCRACTAEHIRGSLISGGPSACENLTCPQCNRKLLHQEIFNLSDTETFEKYERFLLQTMLANEPGFRWCLSPTCNNGQLYQREPRKPKISCEECDFDMCYIHEMPWHDGQTCEEYDSQRDHGDPGFAETREWIRTNTKPCPGCQVGIQKGEACFHMTCSQCSHQFCWQCLADWADIRANGQAGHAEDCYFRSNDVRPTGLRGENLEAALEARNRG